MELYGSKAYFTGFDYLIINSRKKKLEYIKEVERTFKILLLTKNNVICPLSHLYTPVMYNYFKANVSILEEKLIVPAAGNQKRTPADYLAAYEKGTKHKLSITFKKEIIDFYNQFNQKPLVWNANSVMAEFKSGLLNSLVASNSILLSNLTDKSVKLTNDLIKEISKQETLTRFEVNRFISTWVASDKQTFKNYCNLLYHKIGARQLGLECSLPITSYVDYSKNQLLNKKVIISEQEVFLKLLFERMFSMLAIKPLNVDVLDNVSYKNMAALKGRLNRSNFTTEYNKLIEETLKIFSLGGEDISFDQIASPLNSLTKLTETFDNNFMKEIPEIKKHRKQSGILSSNIFSFFVDAIGYTFVGPIITGVKMFIESPDFIFNLSQFFNSNKQLNDVAEYNSMKDDEIIGYVSKYAIKEKTLYSDAIGLIQSIADKSSHI